MLVRHGHRRIVLLARSQHRHPVPSQTLETFLASLAAEGIKASDYHCPFWENTREGFQRCLESLFRVSPPTALVVQETLLFGAVQQFVEARGIRVPRDLSLLCTDPDPSFLWRVPTVAHIRWEGAPIVRRVRRWAENVASGKDDRRQLLTKAEFVPGGTIARIEERDQ
jgi:LacI family transcriptional regulator